MSLLWRTAVLEGRDYGEPPEEYVKQTKHDYLRAHYDDPDFPSTHAPDEPGLHDHLHPRDPQRPERGHTQDVAWKSCPSARDCTHPYTDKKMREIAQQNWDVEHRRLLFPEEHERAQDRLRHEMSGFLSDYALEHPDRVHRLDEHGDPLPPDDPRLRGS